MTDPRRRLRRLDDIGTDDLWSKVEARSGEPEQPSPVLEGPSLGRRLVTIGVAFAVFAAAGVFLFTRFEGSGPAPGRPSPSEAADASIAGNVSDELRVTCTEEGATVEDDRVKLQADGVHVSVDDQVGHEFLYMRDPEKLGESIGLQLQPHDATKNPVGQMRPGTWVAGCFSGDFNTHDVPLSAYSAPFEIVDPDGVWGDLHDAGECGEPFPEPVATAGTQAPFSGPLTGSMTVQAWNYDTGESRAFFINADGTDPHSIVVDGRHVDDVEISPDSTRIVLVIPDDDGDPTVTYAAREDSEIYVMNADGSELTRLTDNRATDDLVHWIPDGRLSFRSNRDRDLTLYTMNADGTEPTKLLGEGSADSHSWTRDGARLAYIGDEPGHPDNGCSFSRELFVSNADGSDPVALTDDELYQQDPSWSPDGSTIAFTASNQSDYAWEIFLVNADGSDLRRITSYDGYDQKPVWSPDGALIAFTSDRFKGPDRRGEDQGGLPYVMNADGSGVQPLLEPADLGLSGDWDVYVTDWRA